MRRSTVLSLPLQLVFPGRSISDPERKIDAVDRRESHLNEELSSWTKWGAPRWDLIGCLALCWSLICASLIKGIASYGKVVYFTTLFPYVVLTIMVGYVATLDGFSEGMEFYFVPKWDKLADVEVWNAAAGQVSMLQNLFFLCH
jgi:SNF family Na+-dependent transporter